MSIAKEVIVGCSLAELFPELTFSKSVADFVPKDMSLDSRAVVSQGIFVAIKGHSVNREDFIDAAIASGASVVLKDGGSDAWCLDSETVIISLKNLKLRLGQIASQFFGASSQSLTLVGITGTNGKTSCADYLFQLWRMQNIKAATLGTLGWRISGEDYHATGLTTLDVVENQRMMSRFVAEGITHVAMEVSSHGIDQGRADGLDFDVKVITNITRDHLDYHGDFETYSKTKLEFTFDESTPAVANLDDQVVYEYVQPECEAHKVFGVSFVHSDAIIFCDSINPNQLGSLVHVSVDEEQFESQINLIGRFNSLNVLLVIGVQLALGTEYRSFHQLIPRIKPALGRLQNIGNVYVDYAHTPDALENVLQALKTHCNGLLILVFGCGGDRDKGKRPLMARAAEKYADRIFVTNDNPRTENPESIIQDTVAGFKNSHGHIIELDRARAIKRAVSEAKSDDIVLVAGKGHENYQEINGKRTPFSDIEEIRKVVA